MANRNTHPAASLDRAVVSLFGTVTFGGSGAVSSTDCLGFDVTKPAGTGVYLITLDDKWQALAGAALVLDVGGTAYDGKVQILDVDLASKEIEVQIVAGTAAADATSGHVLYITLHLRNSGAARKGA